MIILALIVGAIAIEAILVVLVIKTLWMQGEGAERTAVEPRPSHAQEPGAAASAPATVVPFAPRTGAWAHSPRRAGARYLGGHA